MLTEEELAEFSQYIDIERLIYIEHQTDLFKEMKPALIGKFLGEYVAFEDGEVLDRDMDRQALAKRVYEKYGYRDLLMKKVVLEEPVYRVVSSFSAR